jgi:hypothetical protein
MENQLNLVFQYFFTIGVSVGLGLVIGAGLPILIIIKFRGFKNWFSKDKNIRNR